MRRLILSLSLVIALSGWLLAQKPSGFKVTVVCPDAGGLAPTTVSYTINAPNTKAAAGMAIAQFKKDNPGHRNHKQGIYEIVPAT
jgi:hypothetical protein